MLKRLLAMLVLVLACSCGARADSDPAPQPSGMAMAGQRDTATVPPVNQQSPLFALLGVALLLGGMGYAVTHEKQSHRNEASKREEARSKWRG